MSTHTLSSLMICLPAKLSTAGPKFKSCVVQAASAEESRVQEAQQAQRETALQGQREAVLQAQKEAAQQAQEEAPLQAARACRWVCRHRRPPTYRPTGKLPCRLRLRTAGLRQTLLLQTRSRSAPSLQHACHSHLTDAVLHSMPAAS